MKAPTSKDYSGAKAGSSIKSKDQLVRKVNANRYSMDISTQNQRGYLNSNRGQLPNLKGSTPKKSNMISDYRASENMDLTHETLLSDH